MKYLLEIKNRIFFILFLVFSVFCNSYAYKEILLFLFLKPCTVKTLNCDLFIFYFIFTDLTEVFSAYLHLVFFITLQFILFFSVYHCFIFFSPALFKKEYFFFYNLLFSCFITWFFSVIIVNYLIIPLSWNFFFSFQTFISNNFISLHFEPKINEYLNFCLSIYYTFIFYCQLFAIIFVINSSFKQNITKIKQYRKFYYFSFVVFSTFVSPPDIFSQFLISIAIVFVYELSIVLYVTKKILVW